MDKFVSIGPNDQLRQERIRRNWRQQDVANQIGTTVVTVNRWERGGQQPGAYFRVKLCALFGKSAEELGLVEAVPPPTAREVDAPASTSLWGVPYPRNPFFTGREEILKALHAQLGANQVAALTQSYALHGLGGIGKTQVVVEYAYRYSNDYAAIFWICAETYETITSSMITIAELLDLPEKQAKKQEKVVAAVTHWLTNHRDWLLILDNVEDPADIKEVLLSAHRGCLLFTSHRQALGLGVHTLDVEQMTSEEGIHFLLRRARLLDPAMLLDTVPLADLALAQQIVKKMDGLPLALDQAGAYIEATRCSLADYLILFQASQVRLLDERDAHADHPLSVVKTFLISFERLTQTNAAAAELLRVCAFLASDAIPEELFTLGASHLGPLLGSVASSPYQFNQALRDILCYSLLSRQPQTHTLSMHRLVQAVLQESIENTAQWIERIIEAIDAVFPISEPRTWTDCERLLSHALSCTARTWKQANLPLANLLFKVARYLSDRAQYKEAERLYLRSLQIYKRILKPDPLQIASLLNHLAILYRGQSKYKEAEKFYQQAFHIWEQTLGPEHPQVAYLLNNLGVLSAEQGQYKEAETLYQRALSIWEQTLGPEHPQIAYPLMNLAILYLEQSKYEEADLVYEQVLRVWQQAFGLKPLLVAPSRSLQNKPLREQNTYGETESMYQRALHIWEQTVGKEPLLIAPPLSHLGDLYREQNKYGETEPLYQRALHIWEQALGSEHPQVAYPLNNLGELSRGQGKYEEAGAYFQRALHIWEQAFGPEHPLVAYPLNNLGHLYKEQGKYEQAEPLYQQALRIREHRLGPQHPATARTLHSFANLCEAQGDIQEAASLYRRALAIREKVFGSHHPQTTETRECLHAVLQAMGKTEEAARLDATQPEEVKREDEQTTH